MKAADPERDAPDAGDELPEPHADAERIRRAHASLVDEGVLVPLSRDPHETRLWLDHELSSLVENRFFEPLDPASVTPEARAHWEPRATSDEPLSSPHGHTWYRIPYWIVEGGARRGTIALATGYTGARLVSISSLYVPPAHRGRGVATRALTCAHAAVRAQGSLGLRVPTHWTWQPAVRFYLGLGLWVADWKHSLVFAFRTDLPRHVLSIGDREGTFSILRDGEPVPLLHAARDGARLILTELPGFAEADADRRWLSFSAVQTFALALAVRGFPLIRSPALWAARHQASDCGAPEGLAHKIEIFEAIERRAGHLVRTPRLPGLAYRDLDAID